MLVDSNPHVNDAPKGPELYILPILLSLQANLGLSSHGAATSTSHVREEQHQDSGCLMHTSSQYVYMNVQVNLRSKNHAPAACSLFASAIMLRCYAGARGALDMLL